MPRYSPHALISALVVAFTGVIIAGCSVAPGLYVDNVNFDDIPPPSEEALGGEIQIYDVNIHLVRRLKGEYSARLKSTRRLSQKLLLENQQLRDRYEYRLGPSDIINVYAWGHPELSPVGMSATPESALKATDTIFQEPSTPASGTSHEVDLQGNISYPYIGAVEIGGKTVAQARSLITERLARYIAAPQIDIAVSQFVSQRAYVVGEIETPRSLSITDTPLHILDVITQEGGLTERADTRNASLIRDGETYHVDLQAIMEGDVSQNYILRDQDVLVVPDNSFNSVFLLGEFDQTMQLVIPQTRMYSLADAITDSRVGGFSPDVDPRKIFVFRYGENTDSSAALKPQVYHLNVDSAEAMLLAANFPLLPRDIIYAAPTNLVRWNRFVEQLLPTIQAVYETARTYWYIDDLNNPRR